jgi:putative ABC transport system permease protein
MSAAQTAAAEKKDIFLVQFKNKVNIKKAEQQIKDTLHIAEDRMGRNERLLAVIGQSEHKAAVGLYQTAPCCL